VQEGNGTGSERLRPTSASPDFARMNMQSPGEMHEVRRGSDEPQPHMGASIAVYPARLAAMTGQDGSTSAKTNPSRSITSPVRTSIGREKTGAS